MLAQQHSRSFHFYNIDTLQRKTKLVDLPLYGQKVLVSLFNSAIGTQNASAMQANGDIVELTKVLVVNNYGHVKLHFHRLNSIVSELMYRSDEGQNYDLLSFEKNEFDEQTYSSNLIIEGYLPTQGLYRAVLEEVPGICSSTIIEILQNIVSQSIYECFDSNENKSETYTVKRCDGYSSEILEKALNNNKTGQINLPEEPVEVFEQDGAHSSSRPEVTLKVSEAITADNFHSRIDEIIANL